MTASPEDLAGQTLADRYDVLELVGSGGMGAVYRARDRELDELVALKVIRNDLAAMPAMVERFRHEVKLARRVTHTNVARTFELGNAGGIVYCTMELIEGESLTRRLAQRRRLPLAEAVAIASALCDGLAAAHAAGVIHRDIKPDNVLIASDGRVVLADFGVAAVAADAGELSGTPAYMAPEQARGEPPTPAADVYAVGVLLFEMLAGRRAFVGEPATILEAKQALTHVQPAPADMPPDVAQVITAATARERDARIATAAALRRALEPWARSLHAPGQPSRVAGEARDVRTVVILRPPLEPAQRGLYLANEVYEELVARVWKMPRVRVLQAAPAHATGVVTVRVLAEPDRLAASVAYCEEPAVTIRLPLDIDHVTPVADAAAEALDAMLSVDQRFPRDPVRSEARDLLLQARYIMTHELMRIREAIAMLERARVLDPADPRAAAHLAFAHARVAFFMPDSGTGAMQRAIELSQLALSIAPDLADSQIAAGHVALNTGDPVGAAVHFRAAIATAPHMAEGHEFLGRLLLEAGYFDAGVARIEEAGRESAMSTIAQWDIVRALALDGRWAEHEALVARLIANGNDRHVSRARFLYWRRDWAALASIRPQFEEPDTVRVLIPELIRHLFATYLDGRFAEVRAAMLGAADPTSSNARRRAFNAQLVAEAAAFAGDVPTCVDQIQFAYDSGLFDRDWMDKCPLLEAARGDPAFESLRARVRQRAEAILDALYGDRDVGTSDTAIASSVSGR